MVKCGATQGNRLGPHPFSARTGTVAPGGERLITTTGNGARERLPMRRPLIATLAAAVFAFAVHHLRLADVP
ncbi:hypothetical protein ACFH04_00145 [Streptomyces noboritoensis]|uniref:Uncharacterized protein n=1 Tax=Streptomyces noboritoensis TaxID=67337 RepID=A0ABV6TAB1_9ACTN